MNLFKWLKNKAGKMPITITQAAGLTAVVGAAGFAAMNYLSTPSDGNNTFMPPTFNQGEVVYVSQNGGGGQYEANGEVGSSFNAAPSRSIQLANEQAVRQAQTRALEESSQQTPVYGAEGSQTGNTPQAYQLSGADLGLGLGGGKNKDLSASLDTFSTIQNQLAGVTDAVNQAQANAAQQGAQGAKPGEAVAGQSAAQLASAQRNWGNGGLTRAGGGGSGSANSFAIQDSGKNARTRGGSAEEAEQLGNAVAQARAAMSNLQVEGSRMRAQANFGNSEGFRNDRNAGTHASRRFGQGKDELDFIRKKSAAIASNKTNAANEAGSPFLASTKISGGLTVNGDNITTGQGSSSGDLSSFDKQMKGIDAKMNKIQANQDERKLARDELKAWFWRALLAGMAAMITISLLARTFWGWFAAIAMAAVTAAYIWVGAIKQITHYNGVCGSDTWTTLGWTLAGILTGGIVAALIWGPQIAAFIKGLFTSSAEATTGAGTAGSMEGAASGSSVVNGGADAGGAYWA
ncbi:MAG: hypothetical protein IJ876_03565 [Elusimicrobiaceae bacterium]|nr:hypothetical protein [Elusimicrobiaceae bacterium]